MTKRKQIRIPAPIARPGERVLVPNYRAEGAPLEAGTIKTAEYDYGEGAWGYEVTLDRKTPGGRSPGRFMHRSVSDSFFPPIPEKDPAGYVKRRRALCGR